MSENEAYSPLFTDLYELTMAAGYHAAGIDATATFSMFVRRSPRRNFFVAAGLEDALRWLSNLKFSRSDISYLREQSLFTDDFLNRLERFRFTGKVRAMAEGTIFFPDEPVMEITAPIIEAQIAETFLLNTVGFQTLIATKAARCVHAARGRGLIDFSLRRTQGRDAGMKVARSTWLAGFAATSNVLAGKRWGIPISGTMAHSYVGAFDRETDAFAAYADLFPAGSVFLIDTYDPLRGAENAVKVALKMKEEGKSLIGVRLDSGDMVALSRAVRRILDDAGLSDVKIFASSGFDEFKIADALAKGAKIDAFGVGTKMGVSADAPYLDIVYKMVRLGDRNVRKLSPGKVTLAGSKQVFRKVDDAGRFLEDAIGTHDERIETASPLLEPVMENGRTVRELPALADSRSRFEKDFACLDDRYKSIDKPHEYPVAISPRLAALQEPNSMTSGNLSGRSPKGEA